MAFITTTLRLTPRIKSSRATCQRLPKLARRRTLAIPRMSENPPVNAPSGVLLVLSSVLAIASVGSVFELSGGHPQYGKTLTTAVLAVSLPGFLFFFYSAIRKGQQEALEDS